MLVLMPDAQIEDDALIERGVLGEEIEIALHRELTADGIPDEHWQGADALIVYYGVPIDDALIQRLERCRVVVRAGVGYDQIDIAACGARGIPVCNVPDYGTTEVADHAIALMLGLARGVVSYHNQLIADPASGWSYLGAPCVRRLRGRRFGLVGLGRIGTATARRAAAHDMVVSFYDPHLPDGTELGLGYERMDSLEELLAQSDVVSLHCPMSAETAQLIDADALARMKPDALLINTARGGLVDIDALEAALRAGQIGGAGIDVLPAEPPDPAHPLFQALQRREPWAEGRLIMTPHAAWFSESGRNDVRRKSAETAHAYLHHDRLRNCVNADTLATS